MEYLRTGIIGLDTRGTKLLAQLSRSSDFHVQAVADQNKELAQSLGMQYEASAYDDYRSLIVQEQLDVLFLMVPTFLCGECIQLAAKDHINIFKKAPLSRTLSEGCSWVELTKKAGCKFHVGARKRFSPGYLSAYALLQQQKIGRVYLVRAESFFNSDGDFGWKGDPVLAGGGVLLESAYHMIDQITWNMGSPEKVYCLNTNYCNKRVLPPYRTEDTAVVTMHFPDGAMGNLVCGWMAGPSREKLTFYGTEGQIQVDENDLQVFDPDGKIIMQEKFHVDEKWLIEQQICQLGDSINDSDLKPVSTAKEHLVNVAVIESAYLSGQTGQPESPKMHGGLLDIE